MDKNRYELGLYEKAMPNNLSWKEKLELTRESGFDYLEMSVDESDEKLARLDWTQERTGSYQGDYDRDRCTHPFDVPERTPQISAGLQRGNDPKPIVRDHGEGDRPGV